MARVTLEHVRKVYNSGVVAVHGASFAVEDGEFMVLVGPSGCGKSTLLRMVAGLESITDGRLTIGGRPVNDVPPRDRDVAMVFQNYALYPHLSVYDNMALGLKLRRYPKHEIRRRVAQAAATLGIEGILQRKPRQLSGGQRQRVAVGRAIVRKPQVFLFDEPLSNLDAKLRVQMRTEIARIHRQLGATMIYVTHDQVEALTLGDRIVVMQDGLIQQIDTPLRLYHHPASRSVAGFIGSPAMNFVPGRLVHDGGLRFIAAASGSGPEQALTLALGEQAGPDLEAMVGRPVTLGLRPEDLYVAGSAYLSAPTAEIDAVLDVLEPMGHEIVVYAQAGPYPLVARVAPQPLPDPGQPLRLALDLSRLHFFDDETEIALGTTARAPSAV